MVDLPGGPSGVPRSPNAPPRSAPLRASCYALAVRTLVLRKALVLRSLVLRKALAVLCAVLDRAMLLFFGSVIHGI